MTGLVRIPVARPRLPTAERLAPYLLRIDATRWYSNGGPLVQEFEQKVGAILSDKEGSVATVANATIGLTLSLLAYDLPVGSLCMVPAWTFAATAHAILAARLQPWIVDVNRETWALEPVDAQRLLLDAPGPVTAVMPVSPFGAPVDYDSWLRFQEQTGVKVVIDAAAGFDSVHPIALPQVVSLHATKLVGVGEGGFVISTDSSYIEELRKRTNFGFWNSREATAISTNAKMSEYDAAVGLAALDQWPETRALFGVVALNYQKALSGGGSVLLQKGWGESWLSSTAIIQSVDGQMEGLVMLFEKHRIGTRRWWGGGLHRHAAFAELPRTGTGNTDFLADSILGLPCACDLTEAEINEVCEIALSASHHQS